MWYQGRWYQWLLLPLTVLFFLLSALRRVLFIVSVLRAEKLPVPVIVVGNISVGGNGKTPLVVALSQYFSSMGLNVGIISRGYGATTRHFPCFVSTTSNANTVGDEPLLMASRTGLPVVIDPNRPRGAKALISEHNCNLIISDDGLQHYALQRDFEIVVTDRRLFGNGYLLPMGPLREGLWRLNRVDEIVINQAQQRFELPRELQALQPVTMYFKLGDLINVVNPDKRVPIAEFSSSQSVSALAGIGDPSRFFEQLEAAGLTLKQRIALPDHHQLTKQELPQGCVIMTEKDAVKAAAFAHEDCWYQPIDAILPESFYTHIVTKLKMKNTVEDR